MAHSTYFDDDSSPTLTQRSTPDPRPASSPSASAPLECIPVITAIEPPQAAVLKDITIIGQKFTPTAATCGPLDVPPIVTFFDSHQGGTIIAAVTSFSDTRIVARVPDGAKTGLVDVTNSKGISSPIPVSFTVLPTIGSFSPRKGGVGTSVEIRGTGLYNTPQFFFVDKNGRDIPANFSNPTLTSILVAVPDGVVTGPIKGITKGGGTTQTMTDFVVTAAVPQIGDYAPRFGPPGTKVSIFAKPGTKFESIQSVSFLTDPDAIGQARRIRLNRGEFFVSGDLTRIDVLVPDGAVTGKIRVTNESGSAASGVFHVPLAAPTGLVARPIAGAKIELTWRDVTTTEASFRLERTIGENDTSYMPIAMPAANTTSHVDAGVVVDMTYRYRLFAFNSKEGDSAPSNPAIATVNSVLQVTPPRLAFSATRDGANPAPQQIVIERTTNASAEQMWTVSDDTPWLSVRPESGATPGTATVSVDVFGLKSGRYIGVITIRSNGANASIVTVPVELTVKAPAGTSTIDIVIDDEAADVA